MKRHLAWLTAVGCVIGGAALAQSSPAPAPPGAALNGTTSGNAAKGTGSQSLPGIVTKAPLSSTPGSAIGANVPTTPQIALQPTATIGSGTGLAGPGGTTSNAAGN